MRQLAQFLGVFLLAAYFIYQAYEIYFNKEKWASSLYSAYGNFEEFWNKNLKKNLIKELQYGLPKQKEVYIYKHKAAMIMGYLYGFGALLLLTGEKWASLILIVPHLLQTVLVNSPSAQLNISKYNSQQQSLELDLIILAGLIMLTGTELNISSSSKKKAVKTGKK